MIVPAPCTASQLLASDGGAVRHGNRYVATILLTNNSTKSCTLSGYPKVAFLFSNGRAESVTVRFTPNEPNFSEPAPHTVTVKPLRVASFLLGYPAADVHGNSCDAVQTIAISGFRGGGVLRLPDTITPCSTIDVSPYFSR